MGPFNEKRLERLKAKAMIKVVFWGKMIMSLKYDISPTVPTACVRLPDNNPNLIGECTINPDFMAQLPKGQQLTILAHEVAHLILKHPTRGKRMQKRHAAIANIVDLIQQAADYEVNSILQAAKFEPVPGWLQDNQFKDMSFERILQKLIERQSDDCADDQPDDGDQPNKDCQSPNLTTGDPELDELLDMLDDLIDDDQPNQPNQQTPDPGKMGSFEIPENISQQQVKEVEQQIEQAAMQAAVMAKQCGSSPAGMEDHFDNLLNPSLSWDEALADFESAISNEDYSWEQPDEMLLSATSLNGDSIYMPALYSDKLPPIVVACDTSGSITREELDFTASQVVHLFAEVNPEEIHVLWVNTKVNNPQVFTEPPSLEEFKPVTGGGTRYTPAFEYADNIDSPPAGLVYITDGECWDFPRTEPDYPVVWIVTSPRKFKPPFGKVGFINNDHA